MNRFIRYFNQNRVKVVIIILIIAFIIFLIYTINNILGRVNDNIEYEESNVIVDSSRPTESVISGEKIPEETTNYNVEIIEQFVNYCNTKNYQEAYNLLTEDCKEEVFTTLESFISDYCNNIFNTEKTYQLELWYYSSNSYTYRILYEENNILQTGNIGSGNNIEDYITIETYGEGSKLNINAFIEKLDINESLNREGIEILINTRARYRSLEEYNITIANTTDKTIMVSEGLNANDICLIDNNDTEYNIVLSEIPTSYLELTPGERRTMDIRFYKMYNPYRRIEQMEFKNIILDKDLYNQTKNEDLIINMKIDI